MARSICRAKNCYNSKYSRPDLSFFRFPKDEERCKMWLESVTKPGFSEIPTESLHRNNHICAEHFERHCFMNNHRRSLVHNAVPTLYKGKEEEDVSDILSSLHDSGVTHENHLEEIGQFTNTAELPDERQDALQSIDEDTSECHAREILTSFKTVTAEMSDDAETHFQLSAEQHIYTDSGNLASSTTTPSIRTSLMKSVLQDSSTEQVKRKCDNASPVPQKKMIIYVPSNQIQSMELFKDGLFVNGAQINHEVSCKLSNDQVALEDAVGMSVQLSDCYKELNDKSVQTDLTLSSLTQLEKECLSLRRALTMICHRRLVIKKTVPEK